MPVETTDEDLLARLNALRPSIVSFTTTYTTAPAQDADDSPDTELAARFARLKGSASVPQSDEAGDKAQPWDIGEAEDDQSLDDLLKELNNSREDAFISKDEADQARKLLKDARAALDAQRAESQRTADDADIEGAEGGAGVRDAHIPAPDGEVGGEPALTEEQEADEYIQRLLAENALEDKDEAVSKAANHDEDHIGAAHADAHEDGQDQDQDGEDDGTIPLPSAPTFVPTTSDPVPSSSLLPSTPTSAPSSKSKSAPKTSNLKPPGPTDEEIESWCIICTDNATVRCLGCDGDLYCESCWGEGHRGEDAGFEERRHRAVRFVRGGGKKKRLVAAA